MIQPINGNPFKMSDLQALVRQCQAERQAFIQRGERASPACVALFRHAFAGDEAAWDALFTQVFHQELHRWVAAAARVRHFTPADAEEALQESRLFFIRSAPKAPTLLDNGDLDPIIIYLKKCAMSAVIKVSRKLPSLTEVALDDLAGTDEADVDDTSAPPRRQVTAPLERPFTETLDNIREILAELEKILQTDLERLIAQEAFLNGTPPREFLADYSHLLPGDSEKQKLAALNQAIKRIRLRAEKSPTFQQLRSARRKSDGTAFLAYNTADLSEVGEPMKPQVEPCPLDETTLFAYVQGAASAELATMIERSPACVAAAQRLAADVALLTPLFRLALCPAIDTLLDYHAKTLPSTQQLVVHNHVQHCAQCQVEIAMFDAMDAVSLQEEPAILRRIFAAIFLPPTLSAVPVRGALPSLHYRTQIRVPAIDLFIFTQKATGKGRTWTVRGELRTEEGLQFTTVDQLILRATDQGSTEVTELTTTLDDDGMFLFRGLESGVYTLQVLTAEEEILIHALVVGDDH